MPNNTNATPNTPPAAKKIGFGAGDEHEVKVTGPEVMHTRLISAIR
jgi:hypothetical protein